MTYLMAPCKRPSCKFTRTERTTSDGKRKLPRYCSADCSVYMARAKRALHEGDGAHAAELNGLWDALNARKEPTEHVPELFTKPATTT
ncbi:hypothetical protein [Streptomyces sp. 900105755]